MKLEIHREKRNCNISWKPPIRWRSRCRLLSHLAGYSLLKSRPKSMSAGLVFIFSSGGMSLACDNGLLEPGGVSPGRMQGAWALVAQALAHLVKFSPQRVKPEC